MLAILISHLLPGEYFCLALFQVYELVYWTIPLGALKSVYMFAVGLPEVAGSKPGKTHPFSRVGR